MGGGLKNADYGKRNTDFGLNKVRPSPAIHTRQPPLASKAANPCLLSNKATLKAQRPKKNSKPKHLPEFLANLAGHSLFKPFASAKTHPLNPPPQGRGTLHLDNATSQSKGANFQKSIVNGLKPRTAPSLLLRRFKCLASGGQPLKAPHLREGNLLSPPLLREGEPFKPPSLAEGGLGGGYQGVSLEKTMFAKFDKKQSSKTLAFAVRLLQTSPLLSQVCIK